MQRDFGPCVYIVASGRNGTLYTGVTSDLIQRIYQHREGTLPGFTRKHGVNRLVWFEPLATMEHAILPEKRIKKWLRVWKLELIDKDNLAWRDLAEDFGFAPLEPTGSPRSRGRRRWGKCAVRGFRTCSEPLC
jgi:putative endonuclease